MDKFLLVLKMGGLSCLTVAVPFLAELLLSFLLLGEKAINGWFFQFVFGIPLWMWLVSFIILMSSRFSWTKVYCITGAVFVLFAVFFCLSLFILIKSGSGAGSGWV